jgi:hypothetical protein
MRLGKIEIKVLYEKWPSWALGIWLYKNWFATQILMFKVVIQEYIDWDSKHNPIEIIHAGEEISIFSSLTSK